MVAWRSTQDGGVKRKTMLLGPKGAGKTGTAATISRFTPENFPDHKERVICEDLILLQIDEEGDASLRTLGLEIPNVIDLSEIVTATGFGQKHTDIGALIEAVNQSFEMIYEKVAGDARMNVIVDPLSTLDDLTMGHYQIAIDTSKAKFAAFNENTNFHYKFHSKLRRLVCGYTLTAHTKTPVRIDDAQGKGEAMREDKAAGEAMGGVYSPVKVDITGKAENLYLRPCSVVAPVVVKRKALGRGEFKRERVLLPTGNSQLPGSNRYERFLAAEEPANLNKLYQKIDAGVAALKKEQGK